MTKRMLIDALHPEETRVVIADDNQIFDFDFVSAAKNQFKGNIYLAKITRVEPSLQAAFVEYGSGKQGFLPFSEIHPDYYQIPMSDRKRLMEEAEAEARDEESRAPQAEEPVAPQPDDSQDSEQQLQEVPAGEEQAHPAYLMEGAIDVSTSSEEIEQPEMSPAPMPMMDVAPQDEAPVSDTVEAQPETQSEEGTRQEAAAAEGVETIENEDEIRPKKNVYSRRYKIQEVIRRGQIVLVQVIKEERGNKGVSLTTFLSLAGRYVVLMPNSPKDGGISRKIMSQEDRKRLKAITTELRLANGMSVIIRTAGMDRTRAEIKRDYDYLVKVWNGIREMTLQSNAPALIYEESNLIKRALRDQYTNDIDELLIEGDDGYQAAKEFMKLLLPSHTPKIKHYQEPTPLFYAYGIEEQLLSMHDPVVKLRSGGYIVINPTEALISIDVNSGRSTGERNIEETAAKTNLEAANEVARQLRLRDLAGLIVIDFIDMLESRNRRNVERTLKDALKADRAKIQLGRISPFGLLEMSRQRLRPSISETNMVQCPHCVGRGYIRSNESMSIQMIRSLEKEASTGNWGTLRLVAPQTVALHLLNSKRDILRGIEERYGIIVQVTIDLALAASDFTLEKMRKAQGGERGGDQRRGRRNERPRHAEAPQAPAVTMDEHMAEVEDLEMSPEDSEPAFPRHAQEASNDNRGENRGERGRGRRRRRRGGRKQGGEFPQQPALVSDTPGNDMAEASPDMNGNVAPGGLEDPSQRPPRQRGGRGRRRWRDKGDRPAQQGTAAPQGYNGGEQSQADGETLPAFTRESAVAPEPVRQPEPMVATASAPRDPNAPSKKGWWQKMIELDD